MQMRQLIKGRAGLAVCDVKGNDLTATIYCVLVGDTEGTIVLVVKVKKGCLSARL